MHASDAASSGARGGGAEPSRSRRVGVIGVTGYAGSHIAAEAVRRGYEVTGISRTAPDPIPPGVVARPGSIADGELVRSVAREVAALVVAVHGSVGGKPFLLPLVPMLCEAAGAAGIRLGFVGGAGSLLVAPGGPRLVDTPEFPEMFRAEAESHAAVLDALRSSATATDWFYVSPAAEFGAQSPGERTGSYRTGGDVLLVDADGRSHVSGPDFAIAFVDEIEHPAHRRERFCVAH